MRCEVSDADVKGDVGSSVELMINDQFCVIILSRQGEGKRAALGGLLVLQGEYSKKSAKSLRAVKQVPTGSLRLKLRENQVYRGAQA